MSRTAPISRSCGPRGSRRRTPGVPRRPACRGSCTPAPARPPASAEGRGAHHAHLELAVALRGRERPEEGIRRREVVGAIDAVDVPAHAARRSRSPRTPRPPRRGSGSSVREAFRTCRSIRRQPCDVRHERAIGLGLDVQLVPVAMTSTSSANAECGPQPVVELLGLRDALHSAPKSGATVVPPPPVVACVRWTITSAGSDSHVEAHMTRLAGRVALVTGAARRIGRAISAAVAAEGDDRGHGGSPRGRARGRRASVAAASR